MLAFTKITAGLGAIGGIFAYYKFDKANKSYALASWTTAHVETGPKWDSNWDRRAYVSSETKKINGDGIENEKKKPKAVRHIILIRHGQYNLDGITDPDRTLTELGKSQAKMTAMRLKELDLPYTSLVWSTMTRAKETAMIIREALSSEINIQECSLLEEGAPVPPEPPIGHWKPPYHFFQDGARIEAAYRKFFHRADMSQEQDSYDVIVCHANVIRYFVCRALQYPAEGWLRLSLHHASITWLSILPSGRVLLRCYGDAGYMPPYALTTS